MRKSPKDYEASAPREKLLKSVVLFGTILQAIVPPTIKIGRRLPEIERDLKQHYSTIAIDVLGTWQHRGNVELYFKHRYNSFNYPIGKLTEYYRFKDVELVLEDLYSIEEKIFKCEEIEILEKQNLSLINH